jgi:serine/threonine-protein kinase
MGQVYEVEHDLLGTRRALKVLASQFASREDLTERLRVEARGLARLKHPNLVEVYDLGFAADGRMFFVMELLDGGTLRDLLRQCGALGPPVAVRIVAQVLDGLQAAHQAQLVHRDIKPENIFACRNGVIKLLDFGVAKTLDALMPSQPLTGVGMTVGTPRYMAPEQAEGKPVDARTDVYAAGLVLWELLTGRPAFQDPDPVAVAMARLTGGVERLDNAAPATAGPLAAAVMRACARNPSERHCSAAQFAQQLRAAVADEVPAPLWPASAPAQPGLVGHPWQQEAGDADHTSAMTHPTPVHAPDGATTQANRLQGEHTERLEALEGIDRDAPTSAAAARVKALTGPTGTQMLPAVAAQYCPTELSEPSAALASEPQPDSDRGGRPEHGPPPSPQSSRRRAALAITAVVLSVASAIGMLALTGSRPAPGPTPPPMPSEQASAPALPAASPSMAASMLPPTPSAQPAVQPVRMLPTSTATGAPRPKPAAAASALPGSGL